MAKKITRVENPLVNKLDRMTITTLYIATTGNCPILRSLVPDNSTILDEVTEETTHDESFVLRRLVGRCAGAGKSDIYNECKAKDGATVCPLCCRARLINIEIAI